MTVHRAKRTTQQDVARLAGVSQAVVSYVLTDRSAISITEATRSKVMQAVDELGYVPNSAARTLRTQKTRTIAAVIPDITNPFYPEFARGIQDIAESQDYDVLIVNTDGVFDKELKSLQALRRGHVDGVVFVPFHATPDDAKAILGAGVSMVLLGDSRHHWSTIGVDLMIVEQALGVRMAVNYLIEQGHSRIGMIAGIDGTPPREQRVEGYLRALQEHHIQLDPILIRAGEFTEAGGYECMCELLSLSSRPTAVFAANDLMALGAMVALRDAGLKIPDDMAVIGFDDISVARLVSPPLSTIAQQPSLLGRRAGEMLFERINGEVDGEGRTEWHECHFVKRASA